MRFLILILFSTRLDSFWILTMLRGTTFVVRLPARIKQLIIEAGIHDCVNFVIVVIKHIIQKYYPIQTSRIPPRSDV